VGRLSHSRDGDKKIASSALSNDIHTHTSARVICFPAAIFIMHSLIVIFLATLGKFLELITLSA